MESPRRRIEVNGFEEGTPPRPGGKGAPRASPPSQFLGLASVASIDEESPQGRSRDGKACQEPGLGAAQLQKLEATFEQLLSQTVSDMRKDMATREERIGRRIETEHKERQTGLFDLRRELALQQSTDLAAHEERLAHRLDEERREQKAAFAELRSDAASQQEELRDQLVALRRDMSAAQTMVTKLSIERGPGEERPPAEVGPSLRPLEQATAAAEAAIADLRRELSAQREQMRLQASSGEGAMAELRKELLSLHSSEVGALGERLQRCEAEVARGVQEAASSVETMGSSLRSELRREAERLGTELQLERAQAEQRSSLQDTRCSAVGKRLESFESRVEELLRGDRARAGAGAPALEARVGALEASRRDLSESAGNETLDTLRVALDQTRAVASGAQREVARLAQELTDQSAAAAATARPEQPAAGGLPLTQQQLRELSAEILKEVSRLDQKLSEELLMQIRSVEGTAQGGLASCRAALEEASRSIGHLTQDLVRERGERCAALADLSCRAEDAAAAAERAERRTSEELAARSTAPSLEVGDSASVVQSTTQKAANPCGGVFGSAEHVALAACVGELDAELRMEIGERIQKVVGELRGEISKSVGAVEAEFHRYASGSSGIKQVDARLVRLESARLDLRIGALESAWQRAASLVLTGRQTDISELKLPGVGEMEGLGSAESTCSGEAMRKIQQLREMLHEQAQRLAAPELVGLGEDAPYQSSPPALASLPRPAPRGDFCGDSASLMAGSAGDHSPRAGSAYGQAAEAVSQIPEHRFRPQALDAALEDRAQDDPLFQPLISDDLKDRLEVLVRQVRRTLDRSQQNSEELGEACLQAVTADAEFNMDQTQVPMIRCGSASVPCLSSVPIDGGDVMPGLTAPLQAVGVETRVSRVTVGPPVLRQVSISAPRRAPSPRRSQSPLRHSVSTTTTTTRIRSPSPVRRVVAVSSVQPMPIRPEVSAATPRPPLSGSWVGPSLR